VWGAEIVLIDSVWITTSVVSEEQNGVVQRQEGKSPVSRHIPSDGGRFDAGQPDGEISRASRLPLAETILGGYPDWADRTFRRTVVRHASGRRRALFYTLIADAD